MNRMISRLVLGLLAVFCAIFTPPAVAETVETAAPRGFHLVPEMEEPEGILYQPRRRREALRERPDARRGVARLTARVAALWPKIRQVDLVALSRNQVEATRGFALPGAPGELLGQVVGRDEGSGVLYVEVRGPRLPARFEIVYRYLYVYASYDPLGDELGTPTLTIRGWVEE